VHASTSAGTNGRMSSRSVVMWIGTMAMLARPLDVLGEMLGVLDEELAVPASGTGPNDPAW
jgi:hypothetical protein